MSTQPVTIQGQDLVPINDLDRPILPTDFPDYRDLMAVDAEGQDLGRIVDVIINRADRKPVLAVILYGGFMDMGAKHVLVPYTFLGEPDGQTIRATFTRWQAEQAPSFEPKTFADYEPYFRYWFPYQDPAAAHPALQPVIEHTAGDHAPLLRISQANSWQIPEGVIDLRGTTVVDSNGKSLGEIDDWFLSLTHHQPEIVCIRHGGILGIMAHETLVPFDRLERVDDRTFRTRLTVKELDGAPELKSEIYDYAPFYEYWKDPARHANQPGQMEAVGEAEQQISDHGADVLKDEPFPQQPLAQ